MTLVKLLGFFVPQFLHLQNGSDDELCHSLDVSGVECEHRELCELLIQERDRSQTAGVRNGGRETGTGGGPNQECAC